MISPKKLRGILMLPLILGSFGVGTTVVYAHTIEADTTVIHVDEDGFDPETVSVEVGTEVMFENVGAEGHWPATDNHPSHTLYDGTDVEEHCENGASATFDSCESVSPGEMWSFTFNKTGTFTYHNHLWPHLTGEITVASTTAGTEDERSVLARFGDYLSQFFASITSLFVTHDEDLSLNSGSTGDDSYQELVNLYLETVSSEDPRVAIHTLQEDSSQDGEVFAFCHDILHEIGRSAYDEYGSFKEAVKFQSDFCNSGYIHGIFEAYFESVDDPLSGLADQCSEYAAVSGREFDLWQCHHGVGHGFMYLTGGDLDESLSLCEEGLDEDGAESCQNGVFMEVFNQEILAKEPGFVDPENPLETCSSRDVAKGDCYLYIPTYLSQTKELEYAEIFEICDEAEFGYRSSCIHGVGSEAIKRNMDNPEVVFDLCRQAGVFAKQKRCVQGITSMYMNQNGSYASGRELCEQAPREFNSVCNSSVSDKESLFE